MAKEFQHEETRLWYDSTWAPMFVILALIPVVFLAVALYSNWRDAAVGREHDAEAATHLAAYHRAWFPWRDAVEASEGPRARAAAEPPLAAAASASTAVTPPVLPSTFAGRAAEGRGRGRERVVRMPTRELGSELEKEKGIFGRGGRRDNRSSTQVEVGVVGKVQQQPLPYGYGNGYEGGQQSQGSSRYSSQENFDEVPL